MLTERRDDGRNRNGRALALAAADRTFLMIDDHDILFRAGTRRVLEKPVRHAANPLITEDKPWEMAIGWTSVHRDKTTGKYQLWYQAYQERRLEDKVMKNVVCYAESTDGITWTKTNLGLIPFYEEKDTNIVLVGARGGYGERYCNSVVVDERDPDPQKRAFRLGLLARFRDAVHRVADFSKIEG